MNPMNVMCSLHSKSERIDVVGTETSFMSCKNERPSSLNCDHLLYDRSLAADSYIV